MAFLQVFYHHQSRERLHQKLTTSGLFTLAWKNYRQESSLLSQSTITIHYHHYHQFSIHHHHHHYHYPLSPLSPSQVCSPMSKKLLSLSKSLDSPFLSFPSSQKHSLPKKHLPQAGCHRCQAPGSLGVKGSSWCTLVSGVGGDEMRSMKWQQLRWLPIRIVWKRRITPVVLLGIL